MQMQNEEIKLIHCPFCGGKARFVFFEYDRASLPSMGYKYQIECDECGATNNEVGLTVFLFFEKDGSLNVIQDDRFKIADAWNRRAKDVE